MHQASVKQIKNWNWKPVKVRQQKEEFKNKKLLLKKKIQSPNAMNGKVGK